MSFRNLVLFRKRGEVRLLERAEVLRDVRRRLGEEVVERGEEVVEREEEEGRRESEPPKETIPG